MSYLQEVINWLDNRRERANIDDVANITAQFVPKQGESFYSDKGDDYLFALKENYETLRQAALKYERLCQAIEENENTTDRNAKKILTEDIIDRNKVINDITHEILAADVRKIQFILETLRNSSKEYEKYKI